MNEESLDDTYYDENAKQSELELSPDLTAQKTTGSA